MRLVKLMLFAALVAGWWQLWHVHDEVVAAYTDDRPVLELELDGITAVIDERDRPVSPFALRVAGSERAPTYLPLSVPVDEPADDVADPDEPLPDEPLPDDAADDAEPGEDEIESAPQPGELTDETVAIRVTGGEARLDGTVQLPDGTPVAGATVLIERFTSDGRGAAQTVTGPDGTWRAEGLRGGRLRVRAFAPSQLASVQPSVFVVARTGSANVPLTVTLPEPGLRFEMFGPPGIAIGASDTAAIVVSRQTVDELGRLVETPVIGQPFSAVIAGARLLSADRVTTDAGGAVRFLLACDGPSEPLATMVDGEERSLVTMPPCLTVEALAELVAAAEAERVGTTENTRVGGTR